MGGSDQVVRLVEAPTSPQATYQIVLLFGHLESVTGLAFSADGGKLATSSEDGTVVLWNVSQP